MEQLLETSQLARVLGTSRQRAAELAESPGFPEPQPSGGQGPLWARRAVERWAAAHPDRGPAWRRPSIRPIVAFRTGQVREIMDLAVAQAQALDHGWLGDEHLLLALLDGDCPGAAPAALDSCDLTLGAVRAATAEVVGEPCPTAYHGILVSHRTQYVGERANLKAVELRDEEVASEHVLLACSRPRPKAARGRCYRAPESTSTRSAEL